MPPRRGWNSLSASRRDLPERLVGDPGRLRQIIVNLVGNAIKFTERGEVVVDVESQTRSNGDVVLHFSVRDTGIGIPEKKQQLIFEAFSQADAATTRRFGGTGLGLAISSQLVRLMGGSIWVESAVGRGTTFHFTAEFKVSQEQPSTSQLQLASLSALPTLVVDDNATNRRILDEMLKSWTLAPTVADGGVAALSELQRAAYEGDPYRLVLLDCMMPGMDGFSLAELIGGNSMLECPTMIMISSAARRGDAERCRKLGITRHMTKPVIKSELFDAIVDALGRHVRSLEISEPTYLAALPAHPCTSCWSRTALINQRVGDRLSGTGRAQSFTCRTMGRKRLMRWSTKLRSRADGRANAGDGRTRSDRRYPREKRDRRSPQDHRYDGSSHER